MNKLKELLRSFIPRMNWTEESQMTEAFAAIDELPEESAPTSRATKAGVKNADGSDKS